jgi:hypothetical protein
VAPGGNGTGFCGEYRVAAAVRGAALPVRRATGAVGSCPASDGRNGREAGGVLAAAGPVPAVLHGLGHWHYAARDEVAQVIRRWLNDHPRQRTACAPAPRGPPPEESCNARELA